MASAKVAPTRSFSPCFHPTTLTPAATTTMLARDTIHWSTPGGEGSENRAMCSTAPVGRKNS
eukprot:6605854-Alexandrium_andersonii.AAC.1